MAGAQPGGAGGRAGTGASSGDFADDSCDGRARAID